MQGNHDVAFGFKPQCSQKAALCTALPPNGGACTKLRNGEVELNEQVKIKTAERRSRNRRRRTDKEKREEDMAEKDMTTEGHQSTEAEGLVDKKPGQSGWKVGEC